MLLVSILTCAGLLTRTVAVMRCRRCAPAVNMASEQSLDLAFGKWHNSTQEAIVKERLMESMRYELNRIVQPDMTVPTQYKGFEKAVHLPPSATTDELLEEARRVHGLGTNTAIRLIVKGTTVPLGLELGRSVIAIPTEGAVPGAWPVFVMPKVMHERPMEAMQHELNRNGDRKMAVPTKYMGFAKVVHLPPTATTDELLEEARRVHGLGNDTAVRLIVKGTTVPLGLELGRSLIAIPTEGAVPDACPVLVMPRKGKVPKMPTLPATRKATAPKEVARHRARSAKGVKWWRRRLERFRQQSEVQQHEERRADVGTSSCNGSGSSFVGAEPGTGGADAGDIVAALRAERAEAARGLERLEAERRLVAEQVAGARVELDSLQRQIRSLRQELSRGRRPISDMFSSIRPRRG